MQSQAQPGSDCGLCAECGQQTHRMMCCGLWFVALTEPGKVYRGICLDCHPHLGPPLEHGGVAAALDAEETLDLRVSASTEARAANRIPSRKHVV